MDKITLNFTPQELDYVVQVLAERPFKEVGTLIQNILLQANNQPKPTEVSNGPT